MKKTFPPLFDLKIENSYIIEVADFESDLGLCSLVSELFAFYHIRSGRFGRVHVLIMPALILLVCNSASLMHFKVLCERAKRASYRA